MQLMNVQVTNADKIQALSYLEQLIESDRPSYTIFVNSDVLVKAEKDEKLREIISGADLTLTDGMPLIWISRLHRRPIQEKVSGSDLVPELCAMASKKHWSIFLLGGAEGIPQKAAENLRKKFPQIQIAGTYSPPMGFEKQPEEVEKICSMIREASPRIVVACFGCPKQERFVHDNYKNCGPVLWICAGATVDFLAGNIRRCPLWISQIGFEWFFRFMMEPRRLFKRYFIDDMVIFKMAFQYRPSIKRVLMACSDLKKVKGGMVTMVRNLLGYDGWGEFHINYVATHVEGSIIRKGFLFTCSVIKILFLLLAGRVDFLHLHVSERGSFYRKALLLRMGKWFGKPVILHHHGAEFQLFYDGLSANGKDYVRRILEAADCNILLSSALVQGLLDKAPKARYEIVYNAVSVPEKNPYRGGDAIVTLGRLGERKGTIDLMKAVGELDGSLDPNIKLWLCGDGDLEQIKSMITQMGLEKRVAHVGWISSGEKEELLSHTLCHVLPSYREVLPMSILETMALGIPNISTNIASIPEVIRHAENGFLISPGDTESLKHFLLTLCREPELCSGMSRAAYSFMKEQFSLQSGCKKIKMIYDRLI